MNAQRRLSVVVAIVWLILDQLSKRWAINRLSDGSIVHVIWTLDFNLSFNSGMAFGQARGFGPIIGIIGLGVLVVLLLGLRVEGSWLSAVGVGLVLGGALGNLTDRMFRGDGWLRGSVIDFIDVNWWPVFNVADIGVTVGATLLILASVFGNRRAQPSTAGPSTAEPSTPEPTAVDE